METALVLVSSRGKVEILRLGFKIGEHNSVSVCVLKLARMTDPSSPFPTSSSVCPKSVSQLHGLVVENNSVGACVW
jgi:hypothetical protein